MYLDTKYFAPLELLYSVFDSGFYKHLVPPGPRKRS